MGYCWDYLRVGEIKGPDLIVDLAGWEGEVFEGLRGHFVLQGLISRVRYQGGRICAEKSFCK